MEQYVAYRSSPVSHYAMKGKLADGCSKIYLHSPVIFTYILTLYAIAGSTTMQWLFQASRILKSSPQSLEKQG